MKMALPQLPSDIATNIFIRLPAKQVAKMRCVSKPLNALLSQPSFIKSHLNRSIQDNDKILLVFHRGFSFDDKPFTAHPSQSPHLEVTDIIKLPIVNAPSGGSARCNIIGSVNGLICFSYESDSARAIYIWNPSLSALLPLPRYTNSSHCDDILLWFGYDPKTDDYNVVKLTSLLRPPRSFKFAEAAILFGTVLYVVKEWLEVEVYSMRKGCWERITQRFPSHITRVFNEEGVCLDGHDGYLHWLAYLDEEQKLQTIVSFDLFAETFSELSLPDSVVDGWNVLGVLAGKLCVMSCITDGVCDVWVMNEYGVAESWVKNHIFSQFSGDIAALGFTSNNEFLFGHFNSRLALYDSVAANVKLFNIMVRIRDSIKIVEYVDSLVWVAPSKRGICSCNISSLQI